ncbi:hypothetical protein Tsubulata_026863 [Turnera subulata]|uniref:RRM domain-containing protein n=1 Tax=Turnera subulata TaxID=218843 RepID=A0A9Q0JKF5_9ROSI|nr:hypothetical protein Tsubulata_026863 [Turnera subulata]
MASPVDSTPSFMNPMVTNEEFKAFHKIDRSLYSRLVIKIGRDPAESMIIMALWIWLEREGHCDDMVFNMLSLPDNLINLFADEAVVCLNCAESERFRFTTDHIYVPLLYSVTKTRLNVRFFYDNRVAVIAAVTKIVHEVCGRAFQDISQYVMRTKKRSSSSVGETSKSQNVQGGGGVQEGMNSVNPNPTPQNQNPEGSVPVMHYDPAELYMDPIMNEAAGGHLQHGPYDPLVHRQAEIADAFSHIKISDAAEENFVPEHDRTIFLTFSKGYPISEDEVRAFFTGKNGNCIEKIYMEEVSAEEQPLYALMVVHTPALIHAILEGKSKAKFTINGKHVWARKFIPKNPRLVNSSSSSASQPTSPAAP